MVMEVWVRCARDCWVRGVFLVSFLFFFIFFFFFNDTATTEIYTLSLHDALPICPFIEPLVGQSSPGLPPQMPGPQDQL